MRQQTTKVAVGLCADSAAMASENQRLLDISRGMAAQLGQEAVNIVNEGGYAAPSGDWVNLHPMVEKAIKAKVSLPPNAPLPTPNVSSVSCLNISVRNETTLKAARQMPEGGGRVLALNFASAIRPGGGFLGGARAQEEYLARSSALHPTLVGDPMYDHHLQLDHKMASDWAILSPDVPVFRTDDSTLLEKLWLCSFLTCAAPVAKAATAATPPPSALMEERIKRVLAIARAYGYQSLVLGAWGCGAFGGDPVTTATYFKEALLGPYLGNFSDVVFAVTDWSSERKFLGPFRDAFEG
jgi:uncharacterized protein (TIGR02452 family)